ncbi:MAG: sulfatase [Phycisphaeraceae bacterium]
MPSRCLRAAVFLLALLSALPLFASDRPNVLLVYVDDMRADFLSAAGHRYLQTPNLDRLAAEGVTYRNAYVNAPLCGPSRATLMTGLLPTEHGIRNHDIIETIIAPHGQQTPAGVFLPHLIDAAGTDQAVIGKWHFGDKTDPNPRPETSRWFTYLGVPQVEGLTELQSYLTQAHTRRYYRDGPDKVLIEQYDTDLMFDVAEDYIGNAVDGPDPFYAFVSLFAPHAPFTPAPRHKNRYWGQGIPASPNLALDEVPATYGNMTYHYERQAEMMLAIDEGVGRLYDTLEQAGELDNTVIIFTSDNGFLFGEHGQFAKGVPWEESLRVPLLVRWGDRLQPGRVDDSLIAQADLGVTIADLLGAQLPDGLYGQSLAEGWRHDRPASDRRDAVSIHYPEDGYDVPVPAWASIVTDDGWKYVAVPDARSLDPATLTGFLPELEPMLINLTEDPYEQVNLIDDPQYAHVLKYLKQRLISELAANAGETRWLTGVGVPGDTDGDDDVDDTDLANAFVHHTGPEGLGLAVSQGDTDGDGDIDDADFATLFSAYTGPRRPPIPGDADGDGDIDDSDLSAVFSHYNGPEGLGKTRANGDTDGDGDVDDLDLGTVFSAYSGPSPTNPVPEPGAWLVLLTGFAVHRRGARPRTFKRRCRF